MANAPIAARPIRRAGLRRTTLSFGRLANIGAAIIGVSAGAGLLIIAASGPGSARPIGSTAG